MIDFCNIFRQQQYLLTWSNGNASNQMYCSYIGLGLKTLRPWRNQQPQHMADDALKTCEQIRTRLCFCLTLTTEGREEDGGFEELSYFPRGREGEIPMWLNNNGALPQRRKVQGIGVQGGRETNWSYCICHRSSEVSLAPQKHSRAFNAT